MADGSKVFSFKGDNVNGFDSSNRQPDPERLVDAYFHSAATLNYVRSMTSGGVSDLCSQAEWKLANVKNDEIRQEYEEAIEEVQEAIRTDEDFSESLKTASLYTSHEGLLLPYEAALTSKVGNSYYNLGAHYIWIGDRTRDINGAHIEYFKGISNPIGIKSGPSMTCEDLKELVQKLNPNKEAGRLTIITRYGAAKVKQLLPLHIQAVKSTGIPVLWVCDPCHGNGIVTETGIKTRNLVDMMSELSSTFQIHEECGSRLGGVHLELTGEDVTECLGGTEGLESQHLTKRYETYCDPRLSYTQSLDVAFLIANQLRLINHPTV
jgi:3-deoxy-7-phosphoheptulonate synthase